MIQHARLRRVAVPSGLLDELLRQPEQQPPGHTHAMQADESLDVLLKHAFSEAPAERDTETVWQKLSRKMRGPSGAPALEGPTQSSLEVELTQSGGWSHPIPFALPIVRSSGMQGRDSAWTFLRFECLGLPNLCNSTLA